MLENFLTYRIFQHLSDIIGASARPNAQQQELIAGLGSFLIDSRSGRMFILSGYAGTGKTSVVSALVRTMLDLKQTCVLLAPTGRAAKVLSKYASRGNERVPAYTIHKYIYRQEKMGADRFSLNDNLFRHALFIVDEASMLSDERDMSSPFGSGCLLDDLLRYVYSGQDCSLLLVGDNAQLPPVGRSASPALDVQHMQGYRIPDLHIASYTLTEVARQANDSGILLNATAIRERIRSSVPHVNEHVSITPAPDVVLIDGSDLQQTLEQSYALCGKEQTLVVTRSNKRTNLYNQGVRAYILWKDDRLSAGDRVMVVRNNYFWSKPYKDIPFLANGDMFEVVRVRNEREMYGYRFLDVTLEGVDYEPTDDNRSFLTQIDATVWLDMLTVADDDTARQMQQTLFNRVAEDYPEIRNKRELIKAVYESPYYNALQIRYAYAVTCHKAQGGQWRHVYIDQGPVPDEQRDLSYLRWLYTAVTRATEKVYLVNYE